jgi:glyoxylase I family protein
MTTNALAHVNLRASRETIESLRGFYCDLLGLRVGERPGFALSGYWLYAGDRDVVHLVVDDEAASRNTGESTFHHTAYECTDRPAFEKRLAERRIAHHVAQVPGRPIVQIFLQDPAGNGVELTFREG